MSIASLRRRCEARLRGLRLPDPFDLQAFCDDLARRRGRPIVLRAVSQLGPCGMWLALPAADYIFCELDTSPVHQQHIIVHELSHVLCEHRSSEIAETEALQHLLPDLDPEMVRLQLHRTSYAAGDEQEAELLASLILERAARPRTVVRAVTPADEALLQHLAASLGANA